MPPIQHWFALVSHPTLHAYLRQLLTDSPPSTFATAPNRTHLHAQYTSDSFSKLASLPQPCSPNSFFFSLVPVLHMLVINFLDDPSRLIASAFVSSSFFSTPFHQNFCLNFFAQLLLLNLLHSLVSSKLFVGMNLSFTLSIFQSALLWNLILFIQPFSSDCSIRA